MRKIPTVFRRDPEDMRRLTDEPHPDAEWVLAGEGTATRKYDGTCVMLDEQGRWWARREVKRDKNEPVGFVEVEFDRVTGKRVGWEPVEQSAFAQWFRDALDHTPPWPAAEHPGEPYYKPGTYELVGPKINRNPEGVEHHTLVPHADADVLSEFMEAARDGQRRSMTTIRATLDVYTEHYATEGAKFEGIVWHHPDGRMAKIKVRDFR